MGERKENELARTIESISFRELEEEEKVIVESK